MNDVCLRRRTLRHKKVNLDQKFSAALCGFPSRRITNGYVNEREKIIIKWMRETTGGGNWNYRRGRAFMNGRNIIWIYGDDFAIYNRKNLLVISFIFM